MARNNKSTYIYKTEQDSVRRANERRKSVDKFDNDKKTLLKEDITNLMEVAFSGKEVILDSNIGTLSGKSEHRFKAKSVAPNYEYKTVTKAIENLHKNNFYNVVSGKTNTAEELMIQTIEYNKDLNIMNQKGKSNESLYGLKNKINHLKRVKQDGVFVAYDLETLGGKDAHGIWRPTHITEFSMHQYKGNGDEIEKIDILMGWKDKDAANKLLTRIESAIKDGTIDYDDELGVAAHRLSLYGDKRVTSKFNEKLGVFQTASFIDSDLGDKKDIERIREGVKFFLEIGEATDKNEHGVSRDVELMMQTIAKTNKLLNSDTPAMLMDYNGSLFDKPIIDFLGNKYLNENPSLKSMFKNGFSLDASGDNHLDIQGVFSHYRNNFSSYDLLGDAVHDIKDERLNRQEHYVKAYYKEQFDKDGLIPHEASSDVTALNYFYTKNAKGLKGKDGNDITLVEYMAEKLESVTEGKQSYNLKPGEHILQAKGKQSTFQGKNMLNFAVDNRNNNIYTADNHMIRDGKILKQDFNVGVGLNDGAYYQLGGVRQIKAGDPYIKAMQDIFPQYSSSDMYAVTLDMMTTGEYQNSRLGSLSQVIILNGETELNAFMSNTFNVVAERDGNGKFKILDRDAFDIREYDVINGQAVYKDVNSNYKKNDSQAIESAVEYHNRKVTTSRAENAMYGDNSYGNIRKALDIQTEAKKILNAPLRGRDLNDLMYGNKGGIEKDLAEKMQIAVTKIMEHNNGIYDSTIDNMSTYMEVISNNSAYYSKVFEALDKTDFKDIQSNTVKKEMFKRVDRHLRESLANNIYDDFSRQKKSVLGDEALQAPIKKFKGMYEIDLGGMAGLQKEKYFDLVQAKDGNLLRLDLDKHNVEYDLIKNVNNLINGNRKIRNKDKAELSNQNFRKFVDHMLQDKDFKNSLSEDFRKELFEIVNEDKQYSHIDVAGRMVSQLKGIKDKNQFAGIISKDLYMKDLTSSSGYTNALNGEKFISTIDDIVGSFVKDTDLRLINGNRSAAQQFVKDNLLQHYLPSTSASNIVQEKASQEMTEYLTELVYSADKIGANIAVNKYGDVTLKHSGHNVLLDLPKIKSDGDSNTWYIKTKNMNNKLMGSLNINPKAGGKSVDMNIGTNFGAAFGSYPMSKNVQSFFEDNISGIATNESMDYIGTIINTGKKKLIKNSTINGFNANDMNSNRLIDVSSISNIMKDLFDSNGGLNYLVKNHNFLDSNLQEVLGKDVARYVKSGKPIEDLDANMTRDLIKNMPHLLEILGVKANVQGTEVEEVLKQISFTGNVKQSSSMVGILGDMSLFSPHAALSNLQRPTVLAAGNAVPIRTEAIKKLEGSGVLAGNLISTASVDKNTMRYVAGVGETTTDVMMNVTYVSTDSLDIIKNTRLPKVLKESKVQENYKEHMNRMFVKLNTYEQERFMDGRVAEQLYGLMPSKVQNISASKDLASAIELMTKDEAVEQAELLMGLRGSISIDNGGKLSYKSATGKYVKRGDSVVQTLGFGDKLEAISPKVQQGLFTHKYMKSNGMALTDDEITKIINKNKDLFMEDGKILSNTNAINKLSSILEQKYEANGLFRIQDISAAGYIKPTTSSTEKGMTNLNYVKTGSLDKKVDSFFKQIGMEDVSRQSVLYDESIDAILAHVGKNKVKAGLKISGFETVDSLKAAINKERNEFNTFLIDNLFDKRAHMFVNDGVFKHGGAGQMQFGHLNKAIDNYMQVHKGGKEAALKDVVKMINYQEKDINGKVTTPNNFLSTKNLNTNKSQNTNFKFENGRLYMDDMSTNLDNLTISDIDKLNNLIMAIDKKVVDLDGKSIVHKKGYIQTEDEDGKIDFTELKKPLIGDWITEEIDGKKVFIAPVTKEDVKLLPDIETQTGTESQYFVLKDKIMALKTQKNNSGSATERLKLTKEINILEAELKNYESVSKRMTVGSTEFQLLERIRVTDEHAQHMKALMDGSVEDKKAIEYLLATDALKGKITRDSSGELIVSDKLKKAALDPWIKRHKSQLTYNPQEELKLTAEDVAEGSPMHHLSDIYKRANEYKYDIGQDSAQKLYQLEMADKAIQFNSKGNITTDKMQDLGFELKKIDDINFEVDEVAKKNMLVDLGPEFEGKNRYVAIAGTGHKLNEDEEILTNGQKEIHSLARRYDEYKELRHDPEQQRKAMDKVMTQADETKTAIEKSIYGKNAYADSLTKAKVDDVNYRYKASGAVTSEFTPGLSQAVKKHGDGKIEINNELLDTRYINGKSLTQLHSEGIHYDYKFISEEAMADMGMLKEETMKLYGANSRQEMIEKLKTTGTMDVTDRYPNNRNDSVLLSHVFLDTDLVGNQTKVAAASGLKMNLDHDGDSVSSFILRYKGKNGAMLDYGMYLNNPEMVKAQSQEAYDSFSNMLGVTTMRAITENKKWAENVNDILVKDALSKPELGDLTKTALVPGGESVLGRIAPAGISHMDSIAGKEENEKQINDLLTEAKAYLGENKVGKITADDLSLEKDKSEIILDKALTVMQDAESNGAIDKAQLTSYENAAIKKVSVDKLALQNSANTGVATTGGINVATRSIKNAAHDTLMDTDALGVDMIRSILDIPEQEAISSKKIVSAYDDKRGRDMTDILGNMFDPIKNRQSTAITHEDKADLRNWFKTHASGKIEGVYDEFADRLSPVIQQHVSEVPDSKFNVVMDLFEGKLDNLSRNEYFQDRRIIHKSRGKLGDGAGYSKDDNMARIAQMIGRGDNTNYSIREEEQKLVRQQAIKKQAYAENFHANSQTTRQTTQAVTNFVDNLGSKSGNLGGSIAMGVLGLAGGLMTAGYASGNPLNDKQASQVAQEGQPMQQPTQTMSIPDFMDKQGGFVTGNSQQGYIINIKADTKKGKKHMQRVMKQAAEASVGGAVSVNMNIRNSGDRGITDSDIENFLERHF